MVKRYVRIAGPGLFAVPVMVRPDHQRTLRTICGRRKKVDERLRIGAKLLPAHDLGHARPIVRVIIKDEVVGHLGERHAVQYLERLASERYEGAYATVEAEIHGGWKAGRKRVDCAVWLDLPERFVAPEKILVVAEVAAAGALETDDNKRRQGNRVGLWIVVTALLALCMCGAISALTSQDDGAETTAASATAAQVAAGETQAVVAGISDPIEASTAEKPTATSTPTPTATPGSPDADLIIEFNPGPGATQKYGDPNALVGEPDLVESPCCTGMLQLGREGSVIVAFIDNTIVNLEGPDFQVYGESAKDDYLIVEVSADGQDWHAFPKVSESPDGLDLDEVNLEFALFVRLTDMQPGTTTGAEVDAVVAIHNGSARELPKAVLAAVATARSVGTAMAQNATATAQTAGTATAQARAHATAQVRANATAQARANATATIQAYKKAPPKGTWYGARSDVSVAVYNFRYRSAGGTFRYVSFGVRVDNDTSGTIHVNPFNCTLVDLDGATYDHDSETYSYYSNPLPGVDVSSGDYAYGGIVFRIPNNTGPGKFIYRDPFGPTIEINLTRRPDKLE